MTRRLLFFALAAGLLTLSVGSPSARAGYIPLPTTLDKLLPAGSFTTAASLGETDTYSKFSFSSSAIPPTTPVLTAGQLNVAQFGPVGNEGGLEFSGAMFAPAGTIVDYKISYVVTAPAGFSLTDAFLGATYNLPAGTTGLVSIGESLFNAITGAAIGSLSVSSPGVISDTITFAGVSSILVKKDILLVGGSLGAGVSIIDQGYSSVPEPASMALLGIGLTGLLTFRRFFKRAPSA